jgi:hypothetical protein
MDSGDVVIVTIIRGVDGSGAAEKTGYSGNRNSHQQTIHKAS